MTKIFRKGFSQFPVIFDLEYFSKMTVLERTNACGSFEYMNVVSFLQYQPKTFLGGLWSQILGIFYYISPYFSYWEPDLTAQGNPIFEYGVVNAGRRTRNVNTQVAKQNFYFTHLFRRSLKSFGG